MCRCDLNKLNENWSSSAGFFDYLFQIRLSFTFHRPRAAEEISIFFILIADIFMSHRLMIKFPEFFVVSFLFDNR